MSIKLVRLGPSGWSYGTSLACARHCRLDPSSTQHGAYVDEDGVFHYQHIDAASGTSTTLPRFQLQYRAAEGLPYEPISKPWTFEFIQGSPGDLLLVQEGSCRILYASLPKQGSDSSDVFLFGSHTAPVCCLSTNGNIVLSGCQGGLLKLWRLSDGQLADTCSLPDKASITAISTLGPLLVAVGSSSSTVTLYDIASGRLLAVQRLMAGPGAVQCMAAWVPHQVLAAANLAPGGPLPPDGGGVLTRQAAEGVAGTGPKALLAVASSSGWLCVFGADQRSSQHQPWSLIHSTGSIIAPGAQPQLAFSPDGTSLAVASPVAQLLGTDAVALAALGAQPGAVSLYEVSSSSVGLSALLPPLLQQQQGQREQLPELLLWHQWSLSSTPVGLFVLPSSGVGLVHGRQLQPAQVLQLYIVPQIGPAQVLKAQHKPPPAPMYSPKHAQQPRVTLLDSYPAPAAATEAATVAETAGSTAAAEPAPAAAVGSRPQQTAVPLPGSRPAGIATSSSSSSSTSQQGDADDALLLNIAERDLAEVAQAIAAAAGSNLDAELASLLAGATAGMRDLEADDLSAGAAPGADTAAALANFSVATTQQQQQQEGEEAEQGFNGAAETSPADVDTAMAAGVDAAAAAGGAFRLPQTLPGARSWRARLAAVGGSEGAADLSALAQALQEEQEQLRQQHQQQQQQQIPEEVEAAAVAAVVSDAARAVEQELPSESSFQHLLPTEQGTAASQHQHALVQQQQVHVQQQEQHLVQQAAGNVQQQPTGPDRHKAAAAGSEGPQEAGLGLQRQRGTAAAEAGAQSPDQPPAAAAAAAAVAVTVADVAGARALPSAAAQEPQPRKLPAMLRVSQRAPAATVSAPTAELVDAKQQPGAGPSRSIRAGVGRAAAGRQPGLTWSQEQSVADAPAADSGAQQQQQQQQQWQAQQQQQQQLDWEQLQVQQRAKRDVSAQQQQQQPKRLSVQERLNLRRQEVLARQQQQQQQGPGVPAAAATVKGAAGGVQAVRGDQRLRGAVLAPASDHPLAAAVQNSSRLLAARIQEAERAPDVVVDPQGPAALKLAAARLADLDLSPEEQQYCYEELPDLKDVPTPTHAPRLVPKQLDAHWVASRSLKPSMDTLFKPQDWQQSFVDPQVLLLPSWPSPQDVVQQLLWPGQRPGVWT